MPAFAASGAQTELRQVVESTFGTTPASPTMKRVRFKKFDLDLKKEVYESDEVRPDRAIQDFRHGFRNVAGSLETELVLGNTDDFLEGALSGTWTAVTSNAQTFGVVSGKFNRASGSFITDGFMVGDEIIASGFTNGANNVRTKITAVTATDLTVTATLTNEAAGAGKTIALGASTAAPGKRLKIGTTKRSYSMEFVYNDINQFELFKGCVFNGLTLDAKPSGLVGLTFDILGQDMPAPTGATVSGSVTQPGTNSPMSAFDGFVYEGSTLNSGLGIITSITLKLDNNRDVMGVIGKKVTPDVFEGRARVTGSFTAFFPDATLLNKFINETETALDLLFADPNGTDFHHVRMPRVKYNKADRTRPKDGPVTVNFDFAALYSSTEGTALIWNRSNNA